MYTFSNLSEEEWEALQTIFEEIYNKESDGTQEYWHYTSANGVLGIFKGFVDKIDDSKTHYVEECSVYASNIRFMNDEKEYNEGDAYYHKLLETEFRNKKITSFDVDNDNIFLISFCGQGDLLSQWKWYGKNSGVSICFNLESIKYRTYDYVDSSGKLDDKQFCDEHTKPIKVKYTDVDKKNFFIELTDYPSISKSKAYALIKPAFVPFCKDEGFLEENESRLVFYTTQLAENDTLKTRFNILYNSSEEGRIKPALNVRFLMKNRMKKNIISKLIVGPGNNQDLVFNFLIHLFDRKNYYFHTESKNKEIIKWEEFINKDDHGMYYVECDDKKNRYGYKCENGIIIMKSAIPFRG